MKRTLSEVDASKIYAMLVENFGEPISNVQQNASTNDTCKNCDDTLLTDSNVCERCGMMDETV